MSVYIYKCENDFGSYVKIDPEVYGHELLTVSDDPTTKYPSYEED